MSNNTIDFGNVKTNSFEALEEGRYSVTIDKAELTQAKSSGADMIAVTFKIADGDSKGRLLWDNFPLSSNAIWKLKTLLASGGSELAEKSATPAQVVASLPGLSVSVYVEPDVTNNGNPKNNLKNYTAIGGEDAPKAKATGTAKKAIF